MSGISEDKVHKHLHRVGLHAVIADHPELDRPWVPEATWPGSNDEEEPAFELWRVIKARAVDRLERLHNLMRHGTFAGSKVRLRIGEGRAMELDLIGTHEEGAFVLELKVRRSAERNAFSELFAYSNAVADVFTLSGRRDVTNVLVATLANAITEQAFLYDLLVNERDVVVYRPHFPSGTTESLVLDLHLPGDAVFQAFTNSLLAHEAMGCAVISFHDWDGWFDSAEEESSVNGYTHKRLSELSGHAAQLMEAEQLHGFCFVRKPWAEIPTFYRNSLFVCALNPFRQAHSARMESMLGQFANGEGDEFQTTLEHGFDGRLVRIAQRAVRECLPRNLQVEVSIPLWSVVHVNPVEVVFSHNFGFRPTGMLREAYTAYLEELYTREAAGMVVEDMSPVQIDVLTDWLRAWRFMEACGFMDGELKTDAT